jgi:hypothetical protein
MSIQNIWRIVVDVDSNGVSTNKHIKAFPIASSTFNQGLGF